MGSAELAVPASWVRGGTSKCWIFQAADVDALPVTRDEFLLRAFGSPDLSADRRHRRGNLDHQQGDHRGEPHERVSRRTWSRYSFAQVSVDHPRVEWMSNCGNCATALALYAVQHELVELDDDVTEFTHAQP